MAFNPFEVNVVDTQEAQDDFEDTELITHVEASTTWTVWRDNMATQIYSHLALQMAENNQPSRKRVNHTWSGEEDKILVECLLEIDELWKGDNGFRPGFATQLEKMMGYRIPVCTLKGTPHITSRIKLLKRHYNAICEMIGSVRGSGFGWNDKDKMIAVEKEIYNEWVKIHPNARGLYMKPFPHFDQLGLIFGKDGATRNDVEGPQDAVDEIEKEVVAAAESGIGADYIFEWLGDTMQTSHYEMTVVDSATQDAPSQSPVSTFVAKKGKKRGRSDEELVVLVADAMKDLNQNYKNSNENISKLVPCFKYQAEDRDKRKSILEELKKIEGLSVPLPQGFT
ncbi:uncharacterized protein LOC133287604 [Gastrolobium bilobum]|uniref:uncharacterized protein LOC133287604 n=1 Tax=Gastrolobium bilobum TaxID=150636 RepID=UPI002AAF45A9|nr:uncharacterized protein LOC133287604 [Gastrolobium bilobum]